MYSLKCDQYDTTRKLTLFGRETLIDLVVLQAEKCAQGSNSKQTGPERCVRTCVLLLPRCVCTHISDVVISSSIIRFSGTSFIY